MKQIIAALLALVILTPAVHAGATCPPELSAISAILIDGETGRVLFEKNAHEQRAIASITKLMTALVAVESGMSLQDEVVIKPEWTGIEGSSIYLQAGETVTFEMLLYGLLLHSGNDAAVAVAGYCYGGMDSFVEQMNIKAAELGMTQTHFKNSNGLSEEGHYSTAYDMALLGRACTENETVSKIVRTKSVVYGKRVFTNHNKLLWRCDGCTGMKTGYTELAGRTLVSSVQRDGRTLIAVTLCAPSDWEDHEKLYKYGFETYSRRMLCAKGEVAANVPVRGSIVPFVKAVTADEVAYPVSMKETVRTEIALPNTLDGPVEKGILLGQIYFYSGDRLIGKTGLISEKAVHSEIAERSGLIQRLLEHFNFGST